MPSGKYERKEGWRPHNYKEVAWEVDKNGCWICTSHRPNQQNGYHEMNRRGKMIKVHRYMYEKYKGKIPDGLLICHKCDNPHCINPKHLFAGTAIDNSLDMVKKGRAKPPCCSGEDCGTSKFTNKQVAEIRKDKRKQVDIAKEYGVSKNTICRIMLRHTYRCVPA